MAEMFAVAPAIGEKIRCANSENYAFTVPVRIVGNFDDAPVPADFVSRCGTMIGGGDLQGIEENPGGIIIFITGGIPFAPGGHRFPAKWNQNLFAPLATGVRMP